MTRQPDDLFDLALGRAVRKAFERERDVESRTGTAEAEVDAGRDLFLGHVRSIIAYWAGEVGNVPPDADVRYRLEGLAFSICVALDGGAAVGPYAVRPISDEGYEGDSIAGGLHELLQAGS